MAPKKAAKKAAKKIAAKHAPHKAGKDARRTYEHLGRVQAIASLATEEQENIRLLVSAADAAFRGEYLKESADLVRAAEHLSFASIVKTGTTSLSHDLVSAIQEEFDHLRERAEEHGAAAEAPKAIRTIYARMVKGAEAAMRQGSYRSALEFARGAEALAHVHDLDENLLSAGSTSKRLQGSR